LSNLGSCLRDSSGEFCALEGSAIPSTHSHSTGETREMREGEGRTGTVPGAIEGAGTGMRNVPGGRSGCNTGKAGRNRRHRWLSCWRGRRRRGGGGWLPSHHQSHPLTHSVTSYILSLHSPALSAHLPANPTLIRPFSIDLSPSPLSSPFSPLMASKYVPSTQPENSGIGRHWQTQLALTVSFLKNLGGPIRLEDLAIRSGVEALLTNSELVAGLQAHDKVKYDHRTGLWAYKVGFFLRPFLPTLSSRSPSLCNQSRLTTSFYPRTPTPYVPLFVSRTPRLPHFLFPIAARLRPLLKIRSPAPPPSRLSRRRSRREETARILGGRDESD
jgi:hypothetical protein